MGIWALYGKGPCDSRLSRAPWMLQSEPMDFAGLYTLGGETATVTQAWADYDWSEMTLARQKRHGSRWGFCDWTVEETDHSRPPCSSSAPLRDLFSAREAQERVYPALRFGGQ